MIVSGYPIISFKSYDYMRLFDGNFIRRSNAGRFLSVYEKVITVDTETYVYPDKQIGFITDWSITIENDCMVIMFRIFWKQLIRLCIHFMQIKSI